MLQAHPSYSISDRGTDPYGVILYLEIDCDEGPLDVVLVGSLEQFNRLYQSSRQTPSYRMAIWLLQRGFALHVLRVKGCDNRTSLLLTSDSTKYSHPKYGREYSSLSNNSEINYDNLTYGATIEFKNNATFSYTKSETGSKIYTEYILYQTKLSESGESYWNAIVLSDDFIVQSTEKDYGIFSNIIEVPYVLKPLTAQYVTESFVETVIKYLQQYAGVFVESQIEYLAKDGSTMVKPENMSPAQYTNWVSKVDKFRITYYSTIRKYLMISTFDVKEDEFINYDVECRYLIKDRIVEAYSRFDSNLRNIKMVIDGLGQSIIDGNLVNVYNVTLNKYDLEENLLVSEHYILNTGLTLKEVNDLFGINSTIVDITFYNPSGGDTLPELPIGEYWLDRCPQAWDASIDDFVNRLEDTESLDATILLDPFSGDTETKYLERLEELCTPRNLIFTGYKKGYKYNKLSECIFDNTFNFNGYTYPAYMLQFYLLSQTAALEGVLTLDIEYDKKLENKDSELNINYLFKDNYRTEIMNPLAYYNYSDISLYGVFTIVMIVNGVIFEIKNHPSCTEFDIDSFYAETVRNTKEKLSSDVTVRLDERKIENRECTLKFGVEVQFYYSKYFTLSFNIRL